MPVATTTTSSVCSRRSVESGRNAASRTAHVTPPRTSCPCRPTRRSVRPSATKNRITPNENSAGRFRTCSIVTARAAERLPVTLLETEGPRDSGPRGLKAAQMEPMKWYRRKRGRLDVMKQFVDHGVLETGAWNSEPRPALSRLLQEERLASQEQVEQARGRDAHGGAAGRSPPALGARRRTSTRAT